MIRARRSVKHTYDVMADYRCPECSLPLMWLRETGQAPILYHPESIVKACERTNAQYRAPQQTFEVINEAE